MARVRKSFPCSGPLYHREHRSKRGRAKYGSKWHRSRELRRKIELEKLRIKELEYEIRNIEYSTGHCITIGN